MLAYLVAFFAFGSCAGLTADASWLTEAARKSLAGGLSVKAQMTDGPVQLRGRGRLIIRSVDEFPNGFRGADHEQGISFYHFGDSIRFFLARDIACTERLDFWFQRPTWYVPRKAEILAARECVEQVLGAIPQATSAMSAIRHGNRLAEILGSIMSILYSDDAQYIVQTEEGSELAGLEEFRGLRNLVESISPLREILSATPVEESIQVVLQRYPEDTGNGRYFRRMMESEFGDPMMVHFPAFADSAQNDSVWEISVNSDQFDFDNLDMRAVTSRAFVMHQPYVEYWPRLFSFPPRIAGHLRHGFANTIAGLNDLDAFNGKHKFRDCLPWSSKPFTETLTKEFSMNEYGVTIETFDPHAGGMIRPMLAAFQAAYDKNELVFHEVFGCILQAVRDGQLNIRRDQVGTLMRLARIVSSASGFLQSRRVGRITNIV